MSSDKYLSPFQNPDPVSRYYYAYGVVEQENKIYLVGGYTENYQNTIQVINFANVEKLQDAQTRNWIFIENLKNAVSQPAMIYLGDEILIVGNTGDCTTCQDVQYLNLASNLTGVYAGTIDCGHNFKGLRHSGIYSVVGGGVSIFGGQQAKENCTQQTASAHSVSKEWQCVPNSKPILEGLWKATGTDA